MALGLSHPHSVFRAVQSVNTGPTGEPHHIRPYAVALKSCTTTLQVQVSKTRLKMGGFPRICPNMGFSRGAGCQNPLGKLASHNTWV